jgi:hypothetical protein
LLLHILKRTLPLQLLLHGSVTTAMDILHPKENPVTTTNVVSAMDAVIPSSATVEIALLQLFDGANFDK